MESKSYIPKIYTQSLENSEGITVDHLLREEYKSMIGRVSSRIEEELDLYSKLLLKRGSFNIEELEGEKYDYNASLKLYVPRFFGFSKKDLLVVNISDLVLRNEEGEIIRGPFYALRITESYINDLKNRNGEEELEKRVKSIKRIFDEEGFFDVDPEADLLSLIQEYKQ